jgi:hypothetical protein
MGLGVVIEHPFLAHLSGISNRQRVPGLCCNSPYQCYRFWIILEVCEVSFVPFVARCGTSLANSFAADMVRNAPTLLAGLLDRLHPLVAKLLIRAQRIADVVLSSQLEADRNTSTVLHRLASTLYGRRQEWVRSISDQGNATLWTCPGGQRVAVYQFPVHKLLWRCRLNNGVDRWIPSFQDFDSISVVAGLRPTFVYAAIVLVRAHPAELFAAFDRRGEEVDVGPQPTSVCVAVHHEIFCQVVLCEFITVHPCTVDSVATRLGLIIIPEDELPGLRTYAVGSQDRIASDPLPI